VNLRARRLGSAARFSRCSRPHLGQLGGRRAEGRYRLASLWYLKPGAAESGPSAPPQTNYQILNTYRPHLTLWLTQWFGTGRRRSGSLPALAVGGAAPPSARLSSRSTRQRGRSSRDKIDRHPLAPALLSFLHGQRAPRATVRVADLQRRYAAALDHTPRLAEDRPPSLSPRPQAAAGTRLPRRPAGRGRSMHGDRPTRIEHAPAEHTPHRIGWGDESQPDRLWGRGDQQLRPRRVDSLRRMHARRTTAAEPARRLRRGGVVRFASGLFTRRTRQASTEAPPIPVSNAFSSPPVRRSGRVATSQVLPALPPVTLYHAPSPRQDREAAPTAAPSVAPSTSAPRSSDSSSMNGDPVDIDDLTARVYDAFERRVVVERERRGL